MKIFLDDIRQTPAGFNKTFRTGESLIKFLEENKDLDIEQISFDHDLGEKRIDGYEVIKQLVEINPKITKITFHTDNLIGLKNMYYYLISAQKSDIFRNETYVDKMKYNSIGDKFIPSGYSPIKN